MSSYGHGIVDKDGRPQCEGFMYCCSNRFHAQSMVARLNENHPDPRGPYRVVDLCFENDAAGVEP